MRTRLWGGVGAGGLKPPATRFRRQGRRDKVLDEVSTAIHGGGAAVNVANQPRGFSHRLNLLSWLS